MGPNGAWWFNTSIAKQVNIWLGDFHALCQEMLSVKYNFFLDEIICLRNEVTISTLAAKGFRPRHSISM